MAVGQNVLRKEGYEKLTGAAPYVDDLTLRRDAVRQDNSQHHRTRRINPSSSILLMIVRIIVVDYRDIPEKLRRPDRERSAVAR